jgi:hypothetical protein
MGVRETGTAVTSSASGSIAFCLSKEGPMKVLAFLRKSR